MAKKTHKKKSSPAKAAQRLDLNLLPQEIARHREKGRFRDAIDLCRQLMQRDAQPQWRELLGDLYLDRGRQLADKKMFREAAALWETRRQQCNRQDGIDLYACWLLSAGRPQEAVRLLVSHGDALAGSEQGLLLAQSMAVLALCGDPIILRELPVTHSLVEHLPAAKAALTAYCAGDDQTLAGALKAIPFRSPYRELRLLLQGLRAYGNDPGEGLALLAGMNPHSNWGRLATHIATLGRPVEERLRALLAMETPVREVVSILWGVDPQLRGCLYALAQLAEKSPSSPRDLLQLVLAHADTFGEAETKRLVLAILPHYPDALPLVRKRLRSIGDADLLHARALATEISGKTNIIDGVQAWSVFLEACQKLPRTPSRSLTIALTLRHLAGLYATHPFEGIERQREYLIRSLDYDPDDKDAFVQLIGNCKKDDDTKEMDRWIERAVKTLPDDSEILKLASFRAFDRGAYKKAAGYLEKELVRNPIDNQARIALINTILAHAYKQAESGKIHLVEKELLAAADHARGDAQQGIVEISRGFLYLRQKETAQARDFLEQGYLHRGAGLGADLRMLVDGQRLGLPLKMVVDEWQQLRTRHGRRVDKAMVLNCIELGRSYLSMDLLAFAEGFHYLEDSLGAANRFEYTQQERRSICAFLDKARSYNVLQVFAKTGRKRWPGAPIFIYYESVGKYQGNDDEFQRRASEKEIDRMENALDEAEAQRDGECVDLIEDWLGESSDDGDDDDYSFDDDGFPFFPGDIPEDMRDLPPEFVKAMLEVFAEDFKKPGQPGRKGKGGKRSGFPPFADSSTRGQAEIIARIMEKLERK